MFIYSSFLIAMLVLLLRTKYRFIFYVPLLLQLADILKILMSGGPLSSWAVQLDFTIIIISIALSLMIIFHKIKLASSVSFGLFLLLIYFGVLVPFSSDPWWSFKRYLNVAMPLLLFPASFIIAQDINELRRLVQLSSWLVVAFILNLVISTILQINYYAESFSYGVTFVSPGSVNLFSGYGFTYSLVVLLISYFLSKNAVAKYFNMILYFIGLVILILILKRAYVLVTVLGAAIFVILLTKSQNLKFGLIFITLGFAIYFLFSDLILQAIYARSQEIFIKFNEQGRGIELILYPEVVSSNKNPGLFLFFGTEIFNSQGKFTIIGQELLDKDRLLHSDIAQILYGAGILGLFLFFKFHLLLLFRLLKDRKRLIQLQAPDLYNRFMAMAIAILGTLFLNWFSDGIITAINRVVPYMIIGTTLGVIRQYIRLRTMQYYKLPSND